MKNKPLTKQIIELLNKQDKAVKPKFIIDALKANPKRVYVALSNMFNSGRISRSHGYYYVHRLENETKPIVAQPTHDAMNQLHRENLMLNTRIEKLIGEVDKYHGWCLDWRAQVEKLNEHKKEWEKKYSHSLAVISYLEERLMNLIKHVHDNE